MRQTGLLCNTSTPQSCLVSQGLECGRKQHTLAEAKKFLAIVIIVVPQIEDAWSTKWPFAMTTSSIMKRDRFSLILRFLG